MPRGASAGGGMEHVASADGTRIAVERGGSGPPLVIVNGALSVGTTSNTSALSSSPASRWCATTGEGAARR